MAARTGLSKSTIGRIWKKFDLKPHLQDSFKLSADPLFADVDTTPHALTAEETHVNILDAMQAVARSRTAT
jgi:hypothetical protein